MTTYQPLRRSSAKLGLTGPYHEHIVTRIGATDLTPALSCRNAAATPDTPLLLGFREVAHRHRSRCLHAGNGRRVLACGVRSALAKITIQRRCKRVHSIVNKANRSNSATTNLELETPSCNTKSRVWNCLKTSEKKQRGS